MSLERVVYLEVELGKITVVNENIDRRLTHIEDLLKETQKTISTIQQDLVVRNAKIKFLKTLLVSLTTITTIISGLHLKTIIGELLL